MLPLSVFKGLLDALSEAGHGGPYEEFTVEVNPEDIVEKGEAYVEGLLKLGVNRISMGVQSFDDGILKFMNRRHDADTARRAYAVLEKAGVRNISIDLIFGLPQLSDEQWADTLKKALEISPSGVLPQHISSYQLSVEQGSMLAIIITRYRISPFRVMKPFITAPTGVMSHTSASVPAPIATVADVFQRHATPG